MLIGPRGTLWVVRSGNEEGRAAAGLLPTPLKACLRKGTCGFQGQEFYMHSFFLPVLLEKRRASPVCYASKPVRCFLCDGALTPQKPLQTTSFRPKTEDGAYGRRKIMFKGAVTTPGSRRYGSLRGYCKEAHIMHIQNRPVFFKLSCPLFLSHTSTYVHAPPSFLFPEHFQSIWHNSKLARRPPSAKARLPSPGCSAGRQL